MNKNVFTKSSGNVFADLGLPDADELRAKSDLVIRICAIIRARRLTQAKAAEILGVDQPKVSALTYGKLDGFSTERLFRFLTALDQDVEIRVKEKPASRGRGVIKVFPLRRVLASGRKVAKAKR